MPSSLFVDPSQLRFIALEFAAIEGECWGSDDLSRVFAETYVPGAEGMRGLGNAAANGATAAVVDLATSFEDNQGYPTWIRNMTDPGTTTRAPDNSGGTAVPACPADRPVQTSTTLPDNTKTAARQPVQCCTGWCSKARENGRTPGESGLST
ncbi:hypothetical protein AB4305_19130 [Nocardia sp. 2YAB30]|uniref:hypothetical protein n=1 Tax=unclassified Nocardia TaxID=2637762 RepID=UPI003F98D466